MVVSIQNIFNQIETIFLGGNKQDVNTEGKQFLD